jgi:hypothetical protein
VGEYTFFGKLFQARQELLEFLANNGIVYLTDFGAIDLLHDLYGLEVSGIRDEHFARRILKLTRRAHPFWWHFQIAVTAESDWKVVVSLRAELDSRPWPDKVRSAIRGSLDCLQTPIAVRGKSDRIEWNSLIRSCYHWVLNWIERRQIDSR